MTPSYLTEEKKTALIAELADLKGKKRKEILDTLAYAKSLGDLSENAEYHQAREEQGKLEEKIAHIEQVLQDAVLVEHRGGSVVSIGSKVMVKKVGDSDERAYEIVGNEEADMKEGKVSYSSPLGQALMDHSAGDTVSVQTPKGETKYTIVNVG